MSIAVSLTPIIIEIAVNGGIILSDCTCNSSIYLASKANIIVSIVTSYTYSYIAASTREYNHRHIGTKTQKLNW